MDLGNGVTAEYTAGKVVISALEGKVVLSADLSAVLKPALEGLKAKIDSGEIDIIKGTDLDKGVADMVISAAIAAVG